MRHAVVALSMLPSLALTSHAQGIRITGASTARVVQLRPLRTDSVDVSVLPDTSGLDRILPDGTVARCSSDGFCRFLRAAPVAQVVALMQDLDATAWGLGRGISARAELRMREAVGDGRSLWPQAQQHLDVLALYAEVERERVRARLGRQWYASSLGFRNFDGALVEAQPLGSVTGLRAEGYAGRSLLQGLARDVTSGALAAVEELAPDARGVLLGGTIRWRPSHRRGALRLQYEREIQQDRGALYAERASAAADAWLGQTHLASEVIYDVASGTFNEARLNARHPVTRAVELLAEARHSTPFFPLWTIWGMFSPVGFDEGRLDARWRTASGRFSVTGRSAYRRYDATSAGVTTLPLRSDGWRLGGSVAARLGAAWTVSGNYGVDVGSIATRSDGDLALQWRPASRFSMGARAAAFQTISEWRVGDGRVIGGGTDLSFALRPDVQVAVDAMLYRQRANGRTAEGPWNQSRATLRLEWFVGRDPGERLVERARERTP